MGMLRRHYWVFLGLVLVSYLPNLFHAYVGEEANYTIMSMEMWQRQMFLSVVSFGGVGGRPPLYNWLMIPLAQLLGWPHVLLAARLVTLGATLGTAGVLGLWARFLWPGTSAGRVAPLLYLVSADVLLYRGWLAYADPLFAFLMVTAVFLLWWSAQHERRSVLLLSLLVIFASYLTKVVTAYVFYGVCWLVLLSQREYRRFLLEPRNWGVYVLGLFPMGLWLAVVGRQDAIQVHWQMQDVTSKLLTVGSVPSYLFKLVEFPFTILLGLLPGVLWVGWGLWSQRQQPWPIPVRLLLFMGLLNFFPYWIAPQSAARYVLPEYGFVALLATYYLVHHGSLFVRPRFDPARWIGGFILLGLLVNGWAFPYYQKKVRGENYAAMARKVETLAGETPIYNLDWSSVGLSVVALIESGNFSRPAIILPPPGFTDGVVIAYTPHDISGDRMMILKEQSEQIYLVCRGRGCQGFAGVAQ
ncbi:MAG: hypothetical protein G3H99_00950 [Ferrovum sp.]|nr:hypothetical protein [Ferrovum sp.]NDU86745.1 hypothetical protein [Ferrovum sp.]